MVFIHPNISHLKGSQIHIVFKSIKDFYNGGRIHSTVVVQIHHCEWRIIVLERK